MGKVTTTKIKRARRAKPAVEVSELYGKHSDLTKSRFRVKGNYWLTVENLDDDNEFRITVEYVLDPKKRWDGTVVFEQCLEFGEKPFGDFEAAWTRGVDVFETIRCKKPMKLDNGWLRHSKWFCEKRAGGLRCYVLKNQQHQRPIGRVPRHKAGYHYKISNEFGEDFEMSGSVNKIKTAMWLCDKTLLLLQELKASDQHD